MSGAPLMAFPLMAQTAIELRGYAGGNFQLGNLWILRSPSLVNGEQQTVNRYLY